MTDDDIKTALAGMARFAKAMRHEDEHCVGAWRRLAIYAGKPKAWRAAIRAEEAKLFNPTCEWCVGERERGER